MNLASWAPGLPEDMNWFEEVRGTARLAKTSGFARQPRDYVAIDDKPPAARGACRPPAHHVRLHIHRLTR